MDKLISSPQLRKQAANTSLESFKTFLYVEVNREYWKQAPFIQALLCIYIDSSDVIMNNPNVIGNDNIPLQDNMIEHLLLED